MESAVTPTVVILSAPGTLAGIDPRLRRAGARPVRVPSIALRPVAPSIWMERLARTPPPDTVVVTSRVAVETGLEPWRRAIGRLPPALDVWAVGPGTATAVRRAGLRRVRAPPTVGVAALARSVGRLRPRRIVYFRSDRAGPGLARALRGKGHRVVDLVVYRVGASPPFTARNRRQVLGATLLVVTSPSGLDDLKRRLDRPTFTLLSRTARLVVLGERSRRAARAYGFRRAHVSPSTAAQRFTRYLLEELRNART